MHELNNVQPTDAELEILQVLWQQQPATVKTIHETLSGRREVGYTTTLKQMQRMYDKGWLSRTRRGKVHYYEALLMQRNIQQTLLDRLVDTAFSGSVSQLLIRALGRHTADQSELDALQRWLDQQKSSDHE